MIPTSATQRPHVGMFVGTQERCGIGDYSRALVAAMSPLAEVTTVAGKFGRCTAAEHRRLGEAMNAGDLAHVQHAYAFWGGLALHRSGFPAFLRAIRRPVVMTVHELDSEATGARGLPAPAERAYKRLFNRLTFGSSRIAALIVHAAPLQRGLLELGIPPARIHLMPMPVPAVVPAAGGAACRARWELGDRFVVTIFGFLARRKGYELALDALTRLPASVLLLIAGDAHPADPGDPRAWLREAIVARGLEERVRCAGYVPDEALPELMAASDLVLAPFTAMSASASLHLALAHGRPVLASDLEANRALPCVALFPAGDAQALAAAATELQTSPARRDELAEAARRYAASHGVDRLAREIVALYHEVLARADRH
jgi:glycosyltransferase involved in cell wall biosynthesis